MIDIDPDSPVPIYHQIATAIRSRILSGKIAPGSYLAPMRQAAEMWGVNLHTVRHAYAALARQGLVESRRALGTQVQNTTKGKPRLEPFLAHIVSEAQNLFGITAPELVASLQGRIGTGSAEHPTLYVLECSESQCSDLGHQIEAEWHVRALPWSLERENEPPAGQLVATYFHYNDIRTRWPHRLRATHFFTIQPDPSLFEILARGRSAAAKTERTVTVFELDQPTLDAVASDLSVLPAAREWTIKRRLVADAEEAVRLQERPALFSPRLWADLPEHQRRGADWVEIRYVFDQSELEQMARQEGWQPVLPPLEQGKGNLIAQPIL